jgi:hypothetical protein
LKSKKKKSKNISIRELLEAALQKSAAPASDLYSPAEIALELNTTEKMIAKDRTTHEWGLPFMRIRQKIWYSRSAVLNHLAKFQVNPSEPKPRRRNRKGE